MASEVSSQNSNSVLLGRGIICRYKATKPVTSTSKFVIDMYLCQHPLLLYNQMNFLGWFA